jgi:hypothetical protein
MTQGIPVQARYEATMFSRSRKRCEHADRTSSTSRDGGTETGGLSRHELAWRGAAQQVRRAWNEWSADRPDRAVLFDRYAAALVQEERAAIELERAIAAAARAPDPGDSPDPTLAVGERGRL